MKNKLILLGMVLFVSGASAIPGLINLRDFKRGYNQDAHRLNDKPQEERVFFLKETRSDKQMLAEAQGWSDDEKMAQGYLTVYNHVTHVEEPITDADLEARVAFLEDLIANKIAEWNITEEEFAADDTHVRIALRGLPS
ncbi:hypothetical protein FJ366_03210 [Candidatus Dependentiae bacterium]|nr:hypothetical protein [Candidatus Dependentiae bacterium]